MPSRWRSFAPSSLPASGGVYVVTYSGAGPGRKPVAYVGFSQNVRQRFTGHRAYPPWGVHVTGRITVHVSQCRRWGEGLMREAQLIRRLQPWANTRGKN